MQRRSPPPEAGDCGLQDEGATTSTRDQLPLSAIQADPRAQAREERDPTTIDDYREKLQEGVTFPPLVVFYDGETYWLADGFHRLAAAQAASLETFACEVREGGLRDAILHAVGANAAHGLRRKNSDKRRAVMTLLQDPEWRAWSDHKIAQICGVSQPFVSKLRPVDTENVISMDRTFVHPKTGRPTTMKTARIGGRQERPTELAEDQTPAVPAPNAPTEVLSDTNTAQLGDQRSPLPPYDSVEREAVAEDAAERKDNDLTAERGHEQCARAIAEALDSLDHVAIANKAGNPGEDFHAPASTTELNMNSIDRGEVQVNATGNVVNARYRFKKAELKKVDTILARVAKTRNEVIEEIKEALAEIAPSIASLVASDIIVSRLVGSNQVGSDGMKLSGGPSGRELATQLLNGIPASLRPAALNAQEIEELALWYAECTDSLVAKHSVGAPHAETQD